MRLCPLLAATLAACAPMQPTTMDAWDQGMFGARRSPLIPVRVPVGPHGEVDSAALRRAGGAGAQEGEVRPAHRPVLEAWNRRAAPTYGVLGSGARHKVRWVGLRSAADGSVEAAARALHHRPFTLRLQDGQGRTLASAEAERWGRALYYAEARAPLPGGRLPGQEELACLVEERETGWRAETRALLVPDR